MDNIKVRDMKEIDIDSVLEIEKLSFSTPWSKKSFKMEINGNKLSRYIVATNNEKVVGYAGVWLIVDEGHITNIAVHPNKRKKGIGNILLEALIDICKKKDMDRMTLEVREKNFIAHELYKKYGFKDCGKRPGYYADTKEDAIIMWKEIY
ncbi:MAG: ribosomal-protein-alanine N-acetyltransferase [Firmicutes bacterium]|nr:ribosomal-protein-alanine N-acetyltransferase [Bacillota bacterium]